MSDAAVSAGVRLRTGPEAPPGWDPFVLAHPQGTPFHLADWTRSVAAGLGHAPWWLWAERDGAVAGVFPLSHVRSALFGRRLCSSPQSGYGGQLAEDDGVAAALLARAEEEAERRGVDWLEVRFPAEGPGPPAGPKWHETHLHVTFGGPIAGSASDDDDSLLAAIPKKTRADCRKAAARLTTSQSPVHLDAFFALFAENQHALGTPVLPRRFFRAIAGAASLGPRVLLVRAGDTPVAACLSLRFRDRIVPSWAGAAPAALPLHPNHALYLGVLREARREGCTWFDFGRSKRGSGSYDFKKRWGFPESPLHYAYRLVRAAEPPRMSPSDPRWRRRIDAWKRLPLPVANLAGPWLSPGLS